MLEKFKESKFCKKMKQIRVNRAVLISVVTVLLALAVVLAITAAANRAKKKTPADDPVETGTVTPPENDTKPPETGTDDKPTSADNLIPTSFTVPVADGALGKVHDTSIQVFFPTQGEYRVHLGIDIGTKENAPVSAAADGVVKEVWSDPLMGTCIAVQHGGDCCTIYKNLATDLAKGIEIGSKVKAGQVIAYVGNTANLEAADAPHLHLEMTVGGLSVDPMDYFKKDQFGSADVYEDETSTKENSGKAGK